jgi:hypothetical protein
MGLEPPERMFKKVIESGDKIVLSRINLGYNKDTLKAIFYIFLMFFLSGLIFLAMSLFQKWENDKYPTLWKKTFSGTAVCYWDSCGEKDSLLPQNIEPGKPRIETFPLEKENKELTIEIRISTQPIAKPEASLEIELNNPDKKRVFYLSKEKLFEGKASGSPIKNSTFSSKFNFIADKQGEYTLKITPYNYGIAYIDILVHGVR